MWQIPQRESRGCFTILLMLKEDAMTHYTDTDNTDGHTLYVLLVSLLATVMSFPAVWYFATHAVPAVLA